MGVLMKCLLTVLKSVALIFGIFAMISGAIAAIVLISVKTMSLLGAPEITAPLFIIGYIAVVLGICLGVGECVADRSKS